MSPNGSNPGQPDPSSGFPNAGDSQLPVVPQYSHGSPLGFPSSGLAWSGSSEAGEGMNFMGFLHSVRRRWLVATGIGLALATVLAVVMWLLIPINYEALAMFRIYRQTPSIIGPSAHGTDRDFEIYKQTQGTLLKSPYVITAALRKPGVSQLPMLVREEDPIVWLGTELLIDFPGKAEVMRVSLRGEDSKQIKKILEAVVAAYEEEIIEAERGDQFVRLEVLKTAYRKVSKDLEAKEKQRIGLIKSLGTNSSQEIQLKRDIFMRELAAARQQRGFVTNELRLAEMRIALSEVARQNSNWEPTAYQIEDQLALEPAYQVAKEDHRLLKEQYRATSQQVRPGAPALRQIAAQLGSAQGRLNEIVAELKPRVIERLKRQFGQDASQQELSLALLRREQSMLLQRLAEISKQYDELEKKLAELGEDFADVFVLTNEVDGLLKQSALMKQEIHYLDLNSLHSPRIRKIQEALVPKNTDRVFKYVQVFAAWFAVLGLTILGIAFWDYQGRRVNTSKDISDGASLRVMGSLPALNGYRTGGLWPFSQGDSRSLEVVLNYSIDSIRTAMLYNETTRPTDVVMVTSAQGQEGKTTVASQLAASLARSGRRTLLLDADIRSPQQHLVFGTPYDRGFCELLRNEVSLEDVIHPTPAEGLWMIPAGCCDQMSIQALSNGSVNQIFDELKSRFDFVVVDSGPVLTSADPLLLGQRADATILSVRKDVSQVPKVQEACDRLRSVGVFILGSVINGTGAEVRRSELQLAYDDTVEEAPLSD